MNVQLQELFNKQQSYALRLRQSTAHDRIAMLKKLKAAIQALEPEITKALYHDLGKPAFEAKVSEIYFVYAEIDHAIKHLRSWMRPQKVRASLSNIFSRNRIYYQAKGCCLIIAPWNYPFQLVFAPLVSALAAGNCVLVKPSELSVHTSQITKQLLDNCFEEQHVACLNGDAELAKALLKLPFDHIFYTGSTAVGKLVMEAAAQHLSSVTLELGGKSPCVIDQSADLKLAAQKIAWGKLLNVGQTCIAPDYVLLPQDREDEFVAAYKAAVKQLHFIQDKPNPASYGTIINKKHFNRIQSLVADAIADGARIYWGGEANEDKLLIHPVILGRVPFSSSVLNDEIFGPVLPLVTYQHLDEAIAFVNAKPRALALYVFSKNKKAIQSLLQDTITGSCCVNDVLVQIANPHLPFGGVGHSGMGASHGFFGFKSFSHERSVVFRGISDFNQLIFPPYTSKNWILRLLKRIM